MPEIIQMNDFKDFSFKGQKASSFGIIRVSSGNRYNENLNPTLKDTTASITGRDGTVWFDSTHTQRQFKVDFAFDSLTEAQLRNLKKWLNGKDSGELIFDEEPYKAYDVKVTGQSTIKYVYFTKPDYVVVGNPPVTVIENERVYKGEGSITFTAYMPYAHILRTTNTGGERTKDSHVESYWNNYSNIDEWLEELGLSDSELKCANLGDIPTPFVLTYNGTADDMTFYIKDYNNNIVNTLKVVSPTQGIKWDSQTGLVYNLNDGKLARYAGNSLFKLPVTDKDHPYSVYLGDTDITNSDDLKVIYDLLYY